MNEILAAVVAVYALVTTAQYFLIKRLWFNHCQAKVPAIAKHTVTEYRQLAASLARQIMWYPVFSLIAVLLYTGFKFKTKEY